MRHTVPHTPQAETFIYFESVQSRSLEIASRTHKYIIVADGRYIDLNHCKRLSCRVPVRVNFRIAASVQMKKQVLL
jgi:hypothetical protein